MPRFRPAACLLVLFCVLLGLSGCGGDDHEALAVDMMDTIEDVNRVMEGVTDKASAEEALPQLEKLATRMVDMEKRAEALGEPSASAEEALKKKHEQRMEEVMGEMMGHMMRIMMNPEVAGVIGPAMKELNPPR